MPVHRTLYFTGVTDFSVQFWNVGFHIVGLLDSWHSQAGQACCLKQQNSKKTTVMDIRVLL